MPTTTTTAHGEEHAHAQQVGTKRGHASHCLQSFRPQCTAVHRNNIARNRQPARCCGLLNLGSTTATTPVAKQVRYLYGHHGAAVTVNRAWCLHGWFSLRGALASRRD